MDCRYCGVSLRDASRRASHDLCHRCYVFRRNYEHRVEAEPCFDEVMAEHDARERLLATGERIRREGLPLLRVLHG